MWLSKWKFLPSYNRAYSNLILRYRIAEIALRRQFVVASCQVRLVIFRETKAGHTAACRGVALSSGDDESPRPAPLLLIATSSAWPTPCAKCAVLPSNCKLYHTHYSLALYDTYQRTLSEVFYLLIFLASCSLMCDYLHGDLIWSSFWCARTYLDWPAAVVQKIYTLMWRCSYILVKCVYAGADFVIAAFL